MVVVYWNDWFVDVAITSGSGRWLYWLVVVVGGNGGVGCELLVVIAI